MSRRRGFTLVELLVVISIIALLISILAPSLKAARELVKEVFCRTNLNSLNKSVAVYSETNKGFMMVYTHEKVASQNTTEAPYGTPYKSYIAFQDKEYNHTANFDANTGLLKDARNFGLVYASKLLEPPDLYYCPDQKDEKSTLNYFSYKKPWGSYVDEAGGSQFVRIGYMYNPWLVYDALADRTFFEDKLVYAKHPSDRFVTGDLMTRKINESHARGTIVKWNLGFADGHVGSLQNKDGTTTNRSVADYFNRLSAIGYENNCDGDGGIGGASGGWTWWGINTITNAYPMGRQLPNNGTVRYELLSRGSE